MSSIYLPSLATGAGHPTPADLSGSVIPDPAKAEGFVAYVLSTDSFYKLSLTSGATVSADALVTSLGGNSRWLRLNLEADVSFASSWHVPAWFIAPVTGSDNNDGLSALTPLKTYAELVRRWGTQSPALYQDTVITFLESQPDLSDPVSLNAQVVSPTGTLTLQGGLVSQAGGTGTFSNVIAKNQATGQRWTVTADGKPADYWTAFIGMLVYDITTDSYFWVEEDLGGATAVVSEPLGPALTNIVSLSAELGSAIPSQLTIGINDHYEIFAPIKVNLVTLDGFAASGNACNVKQVWVTGDSFTALNLSSLSYFAECRIDSFITTAVLQNYTNCYMFGAIFAGSFVTGGIITFEVSVIQGAENLFDADVLVMAPALAIEGTLVVGAAYFENTLDVPNISNIGTADGSLTISTGTFYGINALWGPCDVNVRPGGDFRYNGTAVSGMLFTGGLTLDSLGTASAFDQATSTWLGPFAVTPANLDAGHPGGFGNCAYGQYGSKIRSIL